MQVSLLSIQSAEKVKVRLKRKNSSYNTCSDLRGLNKPLKCVKTKKEYKTF